MGNRGLVSTAIFCLSVLARGHTYAPSGRHPHWRPKNNLASAYLKQGKLKEAEALYKQVLSRAHEREFGAISEKNRPIWMLADAAEAGSHDGKSHEGIPTDNPAFCTFAVHVLSALRNLSSLYRKQGRIEAADILEKAAKGSKGDKQGIQVS